MQCPLCEGPVKVGELAIPVGFGTELKHPTTSSREARELNSRDDLAVHVQCLKEIVEWAREMGPMILDLMRARSRT